MTIEKWLADVHYDNLGTCILNREKDGGNQMIADIRGWGAIQNMFKTNEEAEKFQDEVGEFIVQAIREKIARTSSQTEISDEEIIKQGFLHSFLNELPDENALSWIEGFKSCIKQLQISNNDIYKAGEEYFNEHVDDKGYDGFIEGAKWYREQLKKK